MQKDCNKIWTVADCFGICLAIRLNRLINILLENRFIKQMCHQKIELCLSLHIVSVLFSSCEEKSFVNFSLQNQKECDKNKFRNNEVEKVVGKVPCSSVSSSFESLCKVLVTWKESKPENLHVFCRGLILVPEVFYKPPKGWWKGWDIYCWLFVLTDQGLLALTAGTWQSQKKRQKSLLHCKVYTVTIGRLQFS